MAIFYSDVAENTGSNSVVTQNGSVANERATLAVTDTLAGGDLLYMHRIKKNDRISLGIARIPDIEDAATNVTLDVGIIYDSPSATVVNDPDGFIDGVGAATASTRVWPSDSLSGALAHDFIAAGDGYVAITVIDAGAGGATKAGTFVTQILKTNGANI